MLCGVEDLVECLRAVPLPFWLFFSALFLGAGVGHVSGLQDFNVYRMHHFDLHGVRYGSRGAVVNMEARGEESSVLTRKCVVLRWAGLTREKLDRLVERGAGALLILLPRNLSDAGWEQLEAWQRLESDLLSSEVPIPVYFGYEDDGELSLVYEQLSKAGEKDRNSSALSALVQSFGSEGYQFISDNKEAEVVKDSHVVSLVGKVIGQGREEDLPTLALVAHYDAMGLATSLSYGQDSNGSGVVALLQLARLFSKLYADPKQRPKYNLLFVLSGGGKLNYFGTKSLLEEHMEDVDVTALLSEAEYTICLDSLSSLPPPSSSLPPPSSSLPPPPPPSRLHLHFSRTPKEGTNSYTLVQHLSQSVRQFFLKREGEGVSELVLRHKKVKLGDDLLAWEHERFSLKRLPAATVSLFESHTDPRRNSMFVDSSHVSMELLHSSVKALAEGVARYIYNFSSEEGEVDESVEVFTNEAVQVDYMTALLSVLSQHSRSPLLLAKDSFLVGVLEQTLSKYTHGVTRFLQKPEESDPEFVFYSVPTTTLQVYSVKPAIFDLFLAIGIALYAFLWYLAVVFTKVDRMFLLKQWKVKAS